MAITGKKNICLAVFSDGISPFNLGGMQKHSTNLVKYFAAKEVKIILFSAVPDQYETALPDIFTPKELGFIEIIPVEFPPAGKLPGHYIRESYLYSRKLFNALERRGYTDIDFIYAQGFTGWYAIKNKQFFPGLPPIGLNFHGLEMFQPAFGLKNRLQQLLFRPFVKRCMVRADLYFSLGARITALAKKISPGIKIAEVPVAVSGSWLKQPDKKEIPVLKPRTFAFVGRYERRKGVEELIEALNTINEPFFIHFIGNLPPSIQQALNKPSQAVFHGPLSENQIKQILSETDVLICPSYSEGMPTVIIEAMASYMAILATDVGAVNELVDDSNGWLIQPGNVKQLSETIKDICKTDPITLHEKQQNSRIKMSRYFVWDKAIEKTEKEIRSFLRNWKSVN